MLIASDARRFGIEVLVYLAIIVVVSFGAGFIFFVLRNKYKQEAQVQAPKLGFTLAELREMHARGELTDEEWERAQARTKAESRALYLGGEEEEDEAEAIVITDDDEPGEAVDAGGSAGPAREEGADGSSGVDEGGLTGAGDAEESGEDGAVEGTGEQADDEPESDEPENKR